MKLTMKSRLSHWKEPSHDLAKLLLSDVGVLYAFCRSFQPPCVLLFLESSYWSKNWILNYSLRYTDLIEKEEFSYNGFRMTGNGPLRIVDIAPSFHLRLSSFSTFLNKFKKFIHDSDKDGHIHIPLSLIVITFWSIHSTLDHPTCKQQIHSKPIFKDSSIFSHFYSKKKFHFDSISMDVSCYLNRSWIHCVQTNCEVLKVHRKNKINRKTID